MAFNAHEVLEAAWKNGPDNERMLWQVLAQLAVGITHIERGNVKGALTLLRHASARLAHDDRPAPYAVDAAHLVAYGDALIADLAVPRSHGSVCDPVWLPSHPNSMGVAADRWSCAAVQDNAERRGNTGQPRTVPHTARSALISVSGEIATTPAGLGNPAAGIDRAVMKAR